MITGRSYRDETVEPSFDLIARLRSRRLRWAGHILRLEETSLIRRVMLATVQRDLDTGARHEGGLLADAPIFDSVDQLLELAGDRDGWRKLVRDLLPEGVSGGGSSKSPKGPSDAFMLASGFCFEDGKWTKNK